MPKLRQSLGRGHRCVVGVLKQETTFMMHCVVMLCFGILISTLAFLRILNHKEGFAREIRFYERINRFLRRSPWLAFVFGCFFGLLGILFIIGSIGCLFVSERKNQCFFQFVFGVLVSGLSFPIAINPKNAFEKTVYYYEGIIEHYRKNPGLAIIQGILIEALGVFLIIASGYCFFRL
jgi:hypothetical protein